MLGAVVVPHGSMVIAEEEMDACQGAREFKPQSP